MILYFNFMLLDLQSILATITDLGLKQTLGLPIIQISNLECWPKIRNLIQTQQSQIKIQNPQRIQMSKDKKLRKIVIEKLYHKNQNPMKQSTRSNAPTESTPNQPKNFSKAIEIFFENFDAECAIIYEPVKVKDPKPLKRSLEEELNFIHRNERLCQNDKRLNLKTQEYERLKASASSFSRNSYTIQKKLSNYDRSQRTFTQYSNCQSKSKQNKSSVYTHALKDNNYKSKYLLFNSLPISENPSISKSKIIQPNSQVAKQRFHQIRMEKPKEVYLKNLTNNLKEETQYFTNSKYVPSKYIPKNAPIKVQQKPQKVDRIKRIQSLKNLNENGIRKYSYKREV